MFDLNKHVARLLMREPFFAALSRTIDKKATDALPTAGVCVNKETGRYEMLYNPAFFEKLTDEHRLGILKHEFYHLVFEHVTGRLPGEGMTKLWNVATDLAINSNIINELPEGALIPGQEGTPFKHMPVGLSAEAYFDLCKKKREEEKEKGQGEGDGGEGNEGGEPGQPGDGNQGEDNKNKSIEDYEFDDHSGWDEVSEEVKEIAKQRLKETLKKAAEEAATKGWGSVSGTTRKDILDRLTPKVDWRSVLRYFIKTSQRANKRSTVKRINKRYAYIHPGKKVTRLAKIAISIDQSGSVSDTMLAAFFAELEGLAKLAEFTVVPFDTEVGEDKVFVWKKGERRNRERVMCGGTCFNAPTKWVNTREFDGHIVLTDMCAPKPVASKCQRMWMTDAANARNPYFQTTERVIAID